MDGQATTATPDEREYLFDAKLLAAFRVKAPNEAEARRKVAEALDCADANLGMMGDEPLLAEVSLDTDEELVLAEVDGQDPATAMPSRKWSINVRAIVRAAIAPDADATIEGWSIYDTQATGPEEGEGTVDATIRCDQAVGVEAPDRATAILRAMDACGPIEVAGATIEGNVEVWVDEAIDVTELEDDGVTPVRPAPASA